MRPIAPLVVAALVFAGCHDEGPGVPVAPARLALAGAGPGVQVSGGGPLVIEELEGAPRGTYAFHAQLDAAGHASGQGEIHFASMAVQVHVDIQCLTIERNEAWLSGPINGSNDARMPEGRVLLWKVQDNGEGGVPFPDRVSAFAYLASGNLPPDACLSRDPMETRAWEQGSVRILTPATLGLSDMVGTWDVTKYICVNLANPADTQNIAGSGVRMRQTVAPNGRFTMIWWTLAPPARIIENTRGWIDVVDGVVRVTSGESPLVIEYPGRRVGNAAFMEFDAPVCHWDDDGEEDPSHVVGESWLKRTGTLVDDVAGSWHATLFRFTSVADPGLTVDLAPGGVTLTVGPDSHYTSQFGPGPGGDDAGEILFEGSLMLTRQSEGSGGSGPEGYAVTFELHGDIWSFTGPALWDFDGNPATPKQPAILRAVLVRQ